MLTGRNEGGWRADSVQQGTEADWLTWARGRRCAEPSKSLPSSYVPVTLVLVGWLKVSRSNSVSIVSGYGLDDWAIEVRSPAEVEGFFPVASVSRPALGPTQPPVQWASGVLSPGVKCGRGVKLTTNPHLVPRSRMSRSYTSSPPKRLHGV
jgi:hypothetical protein